MTFHSLIVELQSQYTYIELFLYVIEDFDMNSWTYCYVMSAGFVFWFAVILLFLGLLYLILIGLSKVKSIMTI